MKRLKRNLTQQTLLGEIKMKKFLKNFFAHLKTISRHRREVRKLCFKCGLYWQGLTHDLSKYSPVEFWNGVKFYTGTASPHLGEREKYGYSKAWLHHKAKNKHHLEYWTDLSGPVDLPGKYFVEMFCDRVAASKIYLGENYHRGSALGYYNTHHDENEFHPNTRRKLEYFLCHLRDFGEAITFDTLKEMLKSGDINREF